MPKKIISLDELSRFKSKYDTKVSGELALKADKVGSLPSYTVNGTDNVISFITNNNLNDKVFILNIGTNAGAYLVPAIGVFRNVYGTTYTFEFERIGSPTRIMGDLIDLSGKTFNNLFITTSNPYLRNYEEVANKVTSLSGSSTDAQYPSAKCVYDNLQNVREVAEGKCKSFVVSYNETEPTEENFIANRWKDADGNPFATWAELSAYITDYEFVNPEFNSQEYFAGHFTYIIDINKVIYLNDGTNTLSNTCHIKLGDVILVAQTDVPDRWNDGGSYYLLESTSLDPSGYVDDHTIAPAYSNQLTYAVGDLVIYDHKLYRCITAVSSAESFDSNKWVQASVSDTFVDLYRNQTITGTKTILDTELNFKKSGVSGNAEWGMEEDQYGRLCIYRYYNNAKVYYWTFDGGILGAGNNQYQEIGQRMRHIGTIFVDLLNKNTSGYGLTLPDTTNFTANKEIATKEDTTPKLLTITSQRHLTSGEAKQCVGGIQVQSDYFLNLGGGVLLKNPYIIGIQVTASTIDITAVGLNPSSQMTFHNARLTINASDDTVAVTESNITTSSLTDISNLIAYAKAQGWIQ